MRGLYAPAPPHPPRSEAVSRLTSTCLLRRFASTVLSLASAQLRNSPHHKAAPRWRSNNPRRPSPVAAEEQRVPDRICSASHGSLGSAIRDTGPGQPAAQGMAALKWRRSVTAPAHQHGSPAPLGCARGRVSLPNPNGAMFTTPTDLLRGVVENVL